jgi:hypothetical protein
MRDIEMGTLIEVLDGITSLEDETHFATLERVVKVLSSAQREVPVALSLYRLLERFPFADSFGLFWPILHFLEGIPDNERLLVTSVRRAPGEFTVLMVNRLLNGGIRSVDGTDLLELLVEIATGPYNESARAQAGRFLVHQGHALPSSK